MNPTVNTENISTTKPRTKGDEESHSEIQKRIKVDESTNTKHELQQDRQQA
jgi:hypothetical protein